MKSKSCCCPASISLIFKYCPDKNLIKMGSIGVGCTIDKGVTVTASESTRSEVIFNTKKIDFPTVGSVIQALTDKYIRVDIKSPLPLGTGFGISGASALSTAFAINDLLNLKKSRSDLIKICHISELINHTGLGSVGTQITGGFLLKRKAGIPVVATGFPFIGHKLYAVIYERMETPSVLKDIKKLDMINLAADTALGEIFQLHNPSLGEILEISYQFAKSSGLLTDDTIIGNIEDIKRLGGHATMLMLGKVIISDQKPEVQENHRIEELIITDDKI